MNKAGVFANTRDGQRGWSAAWDGEHPFLDARAGGKDVLGEDHSGGFMMEN